MERVDAQTGAQRALLVMKRSQPLERNQDQGRRGDELQLGDGHESD